MQSFLSSAFALSFFLLLSHLTLTNNLIHAAEAEPAVSLRPPTNREIFHQVLEEMRATQHATLAQPERSQLLLDLLLKHKGLTGEELHLEFLDWALESLPKK